MSQLQNITQFIKTNILYLIRVACRYYIAYNMFSYAFGKILKTQFNMGLSYLTDTGLDNFNGFMFTWLYYGYSRSYGLVIATTQIIAGLLLLFRKTERLGIVLFLSFMVNILFVDIFYEIDGALWHAAKLTALGFFLLFSDWKGFKTYFLKAFETVQLIPQIVPQKLKKIYWLKFLIIPIMIWYAYDYINNLKQNYMTENELHGIWRIVSGNHDPSHRLYKITFDYHNQIKIKDFSKNLYFGNIELDTVTKTIQLKGKHYSEEAYHFLSDSLAKLPVAQQEDKNLSKEIKNYYHTINESLPFDNVEYTYRIKQDTLILSSSTHKELKFINCTEDYIN
ncbi:hypothetical protein [Aquimarina sp. Aq107]|uniref:hypothetical protein n=1 Tax=Aquimarina sp. Aq107 TaxID=1191912 RepID=UPI00131F34A5|nr:hypothetical protein [Aquimarina sp. Aq107]